MLVAIYHMLKEKEQFRDLGCNYYNEINRDKIAKRHVDGLKRLGYDVALAETG